MIQQFTRLLVPCVLFFLPNLQSFAQTNCAIKGVVTDFETGKPIPNAFVVFDAKKTSFETDSTGTFSFTTTCGEHAVRVNYIGYIPYAYLITVNGTEELTIRLQNKTTQLEESCPKDATCGWRGRCTEGYANVAWRIVSW
jgi:uncharacterized membrane protein